MACGSHEELASASRSWVEKMRIVGEKWKAAGHGETRSRKGTKGEHAATDGRDILKALSARLNEECRSARLLIC